MVDTQLPAARTQVLGVKGQVLKTTVQLPGLKPTTLTVSLLLHFIPGFDHW